MDLNKLVVGGHSFGGMTALSVAEQDSRVKAVFTFDPWVWARTDDISKNNMLIEQPQIHIVTEGFTPVVEKFCSYDTELSVHQLLKTTSQVKKEMIILKGCNHYHQTDAICIVPVEAFIKSGNKPQTNVGDIYLLNTHLVMVFLYQTGFSNAFDPKKLISRVKKLEKKFVEYKIKYEDEKFNVLDIT